MVGGDHIQTLREFATTRERYRPEAQALILLVAVTQWLNPALPASTIVTTGKSAISV
jgi:hypothetical protein